MNSELAIDISGVAHQVWHGIEPSTPALEKQTFRTGLFREIYQAMLETSPTTTILVMDSRSGYWRHDLYRDHYWSRVTVSVDETGMLWMSHDNTTYAIEQTGIGIYSKQKKKAAEIPQNLFWSHLASATEEERFANHLVQIRDHYPKYKGGRNKSKWNQTTLKSEWQDYMVEVTHEIGLALGAAVVQVDKAEADDIMASLAQNKGADRQLFIMSEDGDMDQLQKYPHVTRYRPSAREFIQVEDPIYGIRMKVILGDSGDNVKSLKRLEERKPTKADPRTHILKPIGVKGAEALLAEGQIMQRAIEQGWAEDLEFNSKMIFLGGAPDAIKSEVFTALGKAIRNAKQEGSIYNFGIPQDEIRIMRAVATVKKIKFSSAGTAEEGE